MIVHKKSLILGLPLSLLVWVGLFVPVNTWHGSWARLQLLQVSGKKFFFKCAFSSNDAMRTYFHDHFSLILLMVKRQNTSVFMSGMFALRKVEVVWHVLLVPPCVGSCPLTTCSLPSKQLNWKRLVNCLWCKFRTFHPIAVCCLTGWSSSSLCPSRRTGLWCVDKQKTMLLCLYL